ncbi:MAG: hypothetical protein M3R26_01345, partial [Actinomycetota bacterium]|nr:hypothetical protein [Actinomycetota bacterium]
RGRGVTQPPRSSCGHIPQLCWNRSAGEPALSKRRRLEIVHLFAGTTKEQYEAGLARVHPSDGSLAEGQTYLPAGLV